MMRKMAGVLLLLLLLMGCSNDVEKPRPAQRVVVETPGGKVMIENPAQGPDQRSFTASVEGDEIDATLRLVAVGDGVTTSGTLAELVDPDGHVLFSLETRVIHATDEVIYTQATPEDYMTLGIRTGEERVWERYDVNANVATFDYPALSEDAQRRAINYHEHGLPTASLPAAVSEYVTEVEAFEAYYRPDMTGTLHENAAGALLMQILSSPELPSFVASVGQEDHILKWVNQTCLSARACTALICRTNPSSLVCGACTIVSIACAIFDLIISWMQ